MPQLDGVAATRRILARALHQAAAGHMTLAAPLHVSEATVKTHNNHVFSKIDARDRAAAINYASRHGLGPPRPGSP